MITIEIFFSYHSCIVTTASCLNFCIIVNGTCTLSLIFIWCKEYHLLDPFNHLISYKVRKGRMPIQIYIYV